MKGSYCITALLLAFTLFLPARGGAQEARPQITVTAGSMRSLPDGVLLAEDGVVVRGEGVTVKADRLRFEPDSNTLILSGNVTMEEEGGGAFRGDSLALDLADLTGGISRGEIIIVPNGFRVRGEDINRTGPEEYSVRKGVFTSCPGDCPDWSFTASRIRVRKEGYLEARHAAFRIVGIPVFYTPYLVYPVKTQRQSGLLFPEFRFSDETGIESAWPLFVTHGPHADSTFTLRTFSRDSTGMNYQSRYRLAWGGGGDLSGFAISGDRKERWFIAADHSMAVTPDLWVRGRWYDAGDPTAVTLFGDSFQERHPGVVSRHATVEGKHGLLEYSAGSTRFVGRGELSRSDSTYQTRDRWSAFLGGGPLGPGGLGLRVRFRKDGFEGGTERTLVNPSLELRIPGPGPLAGYLSAEGVLAEDGEGSRKDAARLFQVRETLGLKKGGGWGEHRVNLEVTFLTAQGAAFAPSGVRDFRDLVEERRLVDARVSSRLSVSGFLWDFNLGTWEDTELNLSRTYGSTNLSRGGFFVNASQNRDAAFALVIPSLDTPAATLKGWQAETGYDRGTFGLSVGRESSDGFPEMFRSSGHLQVGGWVLTGESLYDLDAGTVSDETLTLGVPGRCWTVALGRSRSPDRTDWKLKLELGL